MSTKKELVLLFESYSDEAHVVTEQGEDITHLVNLTDGTIVMSSKKPIGVCNRTGGYVYPTVVSGYAGYCPELDEDLFSFEFASIPA